MAELHEYDVTVNGIPTTIRLTEKDAKKRGFTDAHKRAAATPEPPADEPPATPPAETPVLSKSTTAAKK